VITSQLRRRSIWECIPIQYYVNIHRYNACRSLAIHIEALLGAKRSRGKIRITSAAKAEQISLNQHKAKASFHLRLETGLFEKSKASHCWEALVDRNFRFTVCL
jgi:hypothetical protein